MYKNNKNVKHLKVTWTLFIGIVTVPYSLVWHYTTMNVIIGWLYFILLLFYWLYIILFWTAAV